MDELTVVVPAYNEEAHIGAAVDAWLTVLRPLGMKFQLLVLNDGSTDGTARVLEAARIKAPELSVVNKSNSGHGPTILLAYRTVRSAWIFQADSDGEVDPADFAMLWGKRAGHALVMGVRHAEGVPLVRKCVSGVARMLVALLFGTGVHDVNVPFRLFRADDFQSMLRALPEDTLTPNIFLSGWAVRRKISMAFVPVRFRFEIKRKSTLSYRRLLTLSARAALQLASFSFTGGKK